jgi:alanyl-tRNA synthetase
VSGTVHAGDMKELQAFGDTLRERLGSGVGVVGAQFGDGKSALIVVVTDDLRERGLRADALIKEIAAAAGGRGGGKPHMAQAGLPDAGAFPNASKRGLELVGQALAGDA